MAQFHISYVSDCVKDAMDVLVAIPQKKHVRSAASPGLELGSFRQEYPLLLLLHDEASSPQELWAMTNIARFADEQGIMVVMPQGLLSYYTDYAGRDHSDNTSGTGNASIESNFTEMCYESFVMEALRYIRVALPASTARARTFIGGIGMGGFGAFKLIAKHPDEFSAAFSISGDLDLQWLMEHAPDRREQFGAIFGSQRAEGENDLPARCASLSQREEDHRLLQLWTADARQEQNRRFARKLAGHSGYQGEETDVPFDWNYVDNVLKRSLSWL